MERNRRKDFSLTAFYDIFHHRLISLFYLAWKKYKFPVNYLPGAGDRLSGYLLSLTGLGTAGLTKKIGLSEESLICRGRTIYRTDAPFRPGRSDSTRRNQWTNRNRRYLRKLGSGKPDKISHQPGANEL
ncbi:MAG: type VI secretion system baseplate subunit TssG [Deltaproteobacteria bacterium]|nr:type VI secretion system baseplate subunit TssG [Deltaproteobacteria bacterium]